MVSPRTAIWLCVCSEAVLAQVQLPAVVVTDTPESYVTSRSVAATRTDTPIEHVPQSVLVVPRILIEDQGSRTISDALRNISNVNSVDPRDANITGFKIRGFSAAAVIDGVAIPGYSPNNESLVNIERIDVIKGPGGGLSGNSLGFGPFGTQGGAIALTTSKPEPIASNSVGISLGSYAQRAIQFDFNKPLSDTTAMRIQGELAHSGSETEHVTFERQALFPSFSWAPDASKQLLVRLRYLESRGPEHNGLPQSGTLDKSLFSLPDSANLTANNFPETVNRSQGINVQWKQKLASDWDFSLLAAYNENFLNRYGVFSVDAADPSGCFGSVGAGGPLRLMCGGRLAYNWQSTLVAPSFSTKRQLGETSHTFTFGLDYERTQDDAYAVYSNGMGPLSFVPVNISAPYATPDWVEPTAPSSPQLQNQYITSTYYLQDQVDIGNWHLLGGLRYAHVKMDNRNSVLAIDSQTTDDELSPRVGATYDIASGYSVFAGYSEGVRMPTLSILTAPVRPETAKQKEIGLRLTKLAGVNATLALFELKRGNVPIQDMSAPPGFSTQVEKQESRGLDLDLNWQASSQWMWLMALTAQKATTTADKNPALVGKQIFNVPEQAMRVAVKYDFAGEWRGLSAGLGASYTSRLPGNTMNSFFTQAVTVWDAQLAYQTGKARYSLAISNLLDKDYYIPAALFDGGQVFAALPRLVTAKASFHF